MSDDHHTLAAPEDEQYVSSVARAAGLTITPNRLPELTEKYRELLAQLRELDRLDLDGIVPVSGFDPDWRDES